MNTPVFLTTLIVIILLLLVAGIVVVGIFMAKVIRYMDSHEKPKRQQTLNEK
ncbi:hypothetical protein [Arcanobacterium bovis]|uniref:hypothetical protein n=1 Tax=Arcanobacterium bovis TaxID=2529275 RepID=UPI0013F170AF|nr:hypothetical protein [Arcanobacterium bovis]